MKFLYSVELTFEIKGRGCVILAHFDPKDKRPTVNIKDELIIKTEEKTIETFVKSIEMISTRIKPFRYPLAILLPKNIRKEDIPEKSKVYIKEKS